jgi:hypothetical protein
VHNPSVPRPARGVPAAAGRTGADVTRTSRCPNGPDTRGRLSRRRPTEGWGASRVPPPAPQAGWSERRTSVIARSPPLTGWAAGRSRRPRRDKSPGGRDQAACRLDDLRRFA